MPLPSPRVNEDLNDFIGRCVIDPNVVNDFATQDQRIAVCNSLYSQEKEIKAAKENYTAKFSDQLAKAERSSVKDFYKFYNDQYDQASVMFIRQGALSATDVSVFFKENDLINMYTEMYSKIGLHFALWYYKNVDKLLNKASNIDNLMSIWAKSFAFVGQQVGAQRVTLVSGTAKNTLISVTQKLMADPTFMNQGEKVKAKMLKTQFNKYSTYQAKRLVRTEATNAANYATIESALTVFEGGDLMKTWHTSIDGRERESHGAANGQTVPTAGKFSVQGQFLKWAGDPAGSASNVINCRCGVSVFPKPNAQTIGENITDIGFGVAQAQVQSAITEALITPEVAATIVAETISIESNAKTIKEAEQWAVDNNLAKFVNYSNFDVENANKANNALKMVFNDFNIDPLDYIDSGKFRATTSTLAQANGRLLEINQKVYSKEKIISTFKSSVSNWTAGLEKRLELLDSYIGSPLYNAKKLAKALKETKKSLMYERHNVFTSEFNLLSDVMIHESGHIIEGQLLGRINGGRHLQSRFKDRLSGGFNRTNQLNSEYLNIYNNLTEKEKAVISAYGATNSSETLCESLVMYYREPNKLPISLKNFFDKLKEHGKR